jgi:hypothetical protein
VSRSSPCSVLASVCTVLPSLQAPTHRSLDSIPTPRPAAGSYNTESNVSNDTQRAEVVPASQQDILDIPNDPNALDTLPPLTLHHTGSSLLQLTNAAVFDGESEPVVSARQNLTATLQVNRSSPGFSRQVATKLSSTLLQHPTIIHRPKQNSRPTVISNSQRVEGFDDTTSSVQATDAPSPPLQSSRPIDSSNLLLSQSTAPTSLVSNQPWSAETAHRMQSISHHQSNTGLFVHEASTKQLTARWLHFPCQDTPSLSRPSITTVETAAAVKIFFETHFNQLLGTKVTPRSVRRRRLENKLFAMALSNEQRHQRRQKWQTAESHHLRQTRVLKSNTLARRETKGVHISNYDIVRVLGKGSFGVVRLVREKSDHSDSTYNHWYSHNACSVELTQETGPRSRKPKQVYAMKVIRKSDMLRNSQEGHLRAERDFLVASENSRWVVPLVASFQDNNNLYLVMEYMVGGDFLGFLLREDVLDESVAKWYIAEMVLCIEEAHRMNWVHRDIKPDNFLITSSGHLKISDFGLAFDGHWAHNQTYYNEQRYGLLRDLDVKILGDSQDVVESREKQDARRGLERLNGSSGTRQRHQTKHNLANGPIIDWLNRSQRRRFAKSVVGTSQYMAPEVIRGEKYDGRCDWWSLGIILYEVC